MHTVSVVGLDLAKNVFPVHALVVSREWWKFEGGVISG